MKVIGAFTGQRAEDARVVLACTELCGLEACHKAGCMLAPSPQVRQSGVYNTECILLHIAWEGMMFAMFSRFTFAYYGVLEA